MRKNKLVKLVSLVLCMIFLFSLSTNVYAASMPSLSTTNYCEFISPRKIPVYRNQGCTTPGTCSPAKSYSAYIAKGDKCYAYQIGSSYIKVNYPTSSGRKTGYIKRNAISDIFPWNPSYSFVSRGKINTYTIDGTWYGYTEKNDRVICCRVELGGGPTWFPIIYTARSGNRGYKAGWVRLSDYQKIMR